MKEQKHILNGIIVTKKETMNFAGDIAEAYNEDSFVFKKNFIEESSFFSDPFIQKVKTNYSSYLHDKISVFNSNKSLHLTEKRGA